MSPSSCNLIPSRYSQRKLARGIAVFWGSACAVLLFATALYVLRHHSLAADRAQLLSRLAAQVEPVRAMSEKTSHVLQSQRTLTSQWSTVAGVVREDDHLQTLAVVAKCISELGRDVRLESIDLAAEMVAEKDQPPKPLGKLVLRVEVSQDVVAAQLVSKLKQSPRLQNVTLRSTAATGTNGSRAAEIIAGFAIQGGSL